MENLSSDSSDSDLENEVIYPDEYTDSAVNDSGLSDHLKKGLSLNEVNEMVREYEKQEKKEAKQRKKRFDANENVKEVIVDEDLLADTITISQKQFRKLKPKKERSERQIESAKKLVDLRKKKAEEERAIKIKVAPKRKYVRKPKVVEPEEEEEEEEPEEKPVFKSSTGYQARKPKLDLEEDEVEKKVEKLNKLNNVLASSNPFLAQVMASRGIRY